MKPDILEIYTDGACSGNPGPGGWGVVFLYKGEIRTYSGREDPTTNNRMELMAAIKALSCIKTPSKVNIYTDSKYVQQGITQWIHGWKKRQWRNVKNAELWKRLDAAAQSHDVEWFWIKGHDGHKYNEMADALARQEVYGEEKTSD